MRTGEEKVTSYAHRRDSIERLAERPAKLNPTHTVSKTPERPKTPEHLPRPCVLGSYDAGAIFFGLPLRPVALNFSFSLSWSSLRLLSSVESFLFDRLDRSFQSCTILSAGYLSAAVIARTIYPRRVFSRPRGEGGCHGDAVGGTARGLQACSD